MKQILYFSTLMVISLFVFQPFLKAEPSPENLSAQFSAKVWLEKEARYSQARILDAISRVDAKEGAVIASPSRQTPNYYYHWIRDAALTMDVVVKFMLDESDTKQKLFWQKKMDDFVNFTRINQHSSALTGLGEPKFYVDGTPFSGEWGRPQNDGPALRALALIKYADFLLQTGNETYVRQMLYDNKLPSQSVIKSDLEYVSANWRNASFDLWEEVQGDHFYTRMVQRKAMKVGSDFARRMGDLGAADWYLRQANAIEAEIYKHWDSNNEFVLATLNWRSGLKSKSSNLDTAVVLAALHGGMDDGFFDFKDVKVLKTLSLLIEKFYDIYPINRSNQFPAVAIGRYPEDIYDGADFKGGNPWILTTLAVAESFYKVAAFAKNNPDLKKYFDELVRTGDLYVQRVAIHANVDGSMSEQIDRNTGFMTSAENLTWNYSAIHTTMWTRQLTE